MKPQSIAIAALKRQSDLARAVRGAVDAGLPALTSVDSSLPISRIGGANPPQTESIAMNTSNRSGERRASASPVPRGVDGRLPQLTPVDAGLSKAQSDRTNPPMSAVPLSPRQLAAARLLVGGQTPTAVAMELRMTRQGLWKWRRQPAFVAELLRLHELLAVRTTRIPAKQATSLGRNGMRDQTLSQDRAGGRIPVMFDRPAYISQGKALTSPDRAQ